MNKKITILIIIQIMVLSGLGVFPLCADGGGDRLPMVRIPGDVNRISNYTNFFYNYPSEDFIYHLNDRLLFIEKPDKKIMPGGTRSKLLKVVRWHRLMKATLKRIKVKQEKIITLDIATPEGYKKASVIMNLMGLKLSRGKDGQDYKVTPNPSSGAFGYSVFNYIQPRSLETQLNKTHHFHFKLVEDQVPIPWDFKFLSDITGLNITHGNFFETLLKNKRFSLLLGSLYRLSRREIDYIGSLSTGVTGGAWKEIYEDKSFLMGLFILSDALRVTDAKQLQLPGGPGSVKFWHSVSGLHPVNQPLRFLRSVATKDNGKLNFLFLYGKFLPTKTQAVLFTGPNAVRMRNLYQLLQLQEREKLTPTQFPRLRNSNFFTMLYAVDFNRHGFRFPGGAPGWEKISRDITPPPSFSAVSRALESTTLEVPTPTAQTPAEEKPGEVVKQAAKTTKTIRAFTSRGRGQGLYIRVNGGAGFLHGGDFNHLIDINENSEDYSDVNKLPYFRDFSAEIGWDFGKLTVAVEAGRIDKYFNVILDERRFSGNWDRSFTAIPILANLYYKLTDSNTLNIFLNAGGGVYIGKYQDRWKWKYTDYPDSCQTGVDTAEQLRVGAHLGGALQLNITKKLSLFFHARYRFVSFMGLDGNGSYTIDHDNFTKSYNGLLFYLVDDNSGEALASGFVLGYRFDRYLYNGKKAIISLNGPSVTLGLKLDF